MKLTKCKIPMADIAVVPKISQINDETCNPEHIDSLSSNMVHSGQREPGYVLEINEVLLTWIAEEYDSNIADKIRRKRDEEGKTHLLIDGNHRYHAVNTVYGETKLNCFTFFESFIVPAGTFSTRMRLKEFQFDNNLFPNLLFQRPTPTTLKSIVVEWIDSEYFGPNYSNDEIVKTPAKASKLCTLATKNMWDKVKTCGDEYKREDIAEIVTHVVYNVKKGKRADEQTTFRTKRDFKKEALAKFSFKKTNQPNECGEVLMVHDDNDLQSALHGELLRTMASYHSYGKFDKEKPLKFYIAFNVRRHKSKDLTPEENVSRVNTCTESAVKVCEKMNNLLKTNKFPAKIVQLHTKGQSSEQDLNKWYTRKLKSKAF